jgi:hypothetical protein
MKFEAVLDAVTSMYDVIHMHGDEGIPSGHLYALAMPSGMRYDAYQAIIDILVDSGMVTLKHHVLRSAQCQAH